MEILPGKFLFFYKKDKRNIFPILLYLNNIIKFRKKLLHYVFIF